MTADPSPRALITGGQGDLAQAFRHHFEAAAWQVCAPGHAELDVTSADSVTRYFQRETLPFDLLIHNAGITRDAPLARLTETAWDETIDVHLRGAFLCSKAVLPAMMRRKRGHIVTIGSFSALHPAPGQAAYAAAKAGLIAFTQSLAAEYGPRNIRCNCILPGFLETAMTRDLPDEIVSQARSRHVLGRFNSPPDVARFLECLHQLEHVSGQVFQLDSRIRRPG